MLDLRHPWPCLSALIACLGLSACSSRPDLGQTSVHGASGVQWAQLYAEAPIPDARFKLLSKENSAMKSGRRLIMPDFHWLDAHTAVGSLWRLDNWEAGQQEMPQNWAFDLAAGTRQRLPIDGSMTCARPEHLVVVRSVVEGAGHSISRVYPQDVSNIVVGNLVTGLVPFTESALGKAVDVNHPLHANTCLPEADPKEFPKRDGLWYSVLRLGDQAYLGKNDRGLALLPGGAAMPKSVWAVFNPQRQVVTTWDAPCARSFWPSGHAATWPSIQEDIVPVPHLGAYLVNTTGPNPEGGSDCPRMLVYPDGRFEPYPLEAPSDLRALTEHFRLVVGITPRGVVWHVGLRKRGAWPGRAGLYLQPMAPGSSRPADQAIPTLMGDIRVLSALSPDGCRLVVARTPEGEFRRHDLTDEAGKERQKASFMHLNFCAEAIRLRG
jgi:hypothetical protein